MLRHAVAGTYRSDELAASFTVVVANDALQVKMPSGATPTDGNSLDVLEQRRNERYRVRSC